jgi:hypothetical protein
MSESAHGDDWRSAGGARVSWRAPPLSVVRDESEPQINVNQLVLPLGGEELVRHPLYFEMRAREQWLAHGDIDVGSRALQLQTMLRVERHAEERGLLGLKRMRREELQAGVRGWMAIVAEGVALAGFAAGTVVAVARGAGAPIAGFSLPPSATAGVVAVGCGCVAGAIRWARHRRAPTAALPE